MSEWRDIDSAPKDGTKVLLGWIGIVNMGRYSADHSKFIAVNTGNPFYPEQPKYWAKCPDPPARTDPGGNKSGGEEEVEVE